MKDEGVILEEMMFSVSETGKIEKLLSISITDLKGSGSMNRIKKTKEQQSYQFSDESVERYDKWLEEAGKRWSKMEDSPEKVLRILTEMLLASANFSSWDISCRLARSEGKTFEEIVIPQLNARLEKINSEIPKLADKAVEKAISDMEKASKKIELN